MSMDRVLRKMQEARGVVSRVAAHLEEHADAVLSREETLRSRAEEAFAPHHAALLEAGRELDAVERELDLLSNGAPSTPPLPPGTSSSGGADGNR